MIHDGQIYGLPLIDYKDTAAAIEALPGCQAGMTAYAEDTELLGFFDGTVWNWITSAMGASGGGASWLSDLSDVSIPAEPDDESILEWNADHDVWVPIRARLNYENVIVVAKSGGYDFFNIQEAVDAAVDDDVVFIMPGTYTEDVTIGNKQITLVGLDRERCIIQGQMTITTASPDQPRLYNLRLQFNAAGTLLTMTHNGTAHIERCTLYILNTGSGSVIGIDNQSGGTVRVRRSSITAGATGASGDAICYNQTNTGSAVYLERTYLMASATDDASNIRADGVTQLIYVRFCWAEGVAFGGTYYAFESLNSADIDVAFTDYTPTAVVGSITLSDAPEIAKSLVSTTLPSSWDAGSVEIRAETLESDVATGTAPLTIASTTLVSNLNADQVDGYDAVTPTGAEEVVVTNSDGELVLDDGGDVVLQETGRFVPGADAPGLLYRIRWFIGTDGTEDDDGQFEEDFAAYPVAGWSWAGAPFVTPGTIDIWRNTFLRVRALGATNNRAFYYTTSPSTSIKYMNTGIVASSTQLAMGIRLDDGTDNNYVEYVKRYDGVTPNTWVFELRDRTGGGAVNTTTGTVSYWCPMEDQPLKAEFGGTQWSSWTLAGRAITPSGGTLYPIGSTSTMTFTPTRVGILYEQGSSGYATWHSFVCDWVFGFT